MKKVIEKEIKEIINSKIEVPFFREGNFIKFRMPAGMENPQVFLNNIPFLYKKIGGMCYIEAKNHRVFCSPCRNRRPISERSSKVRV